VTVYCSIAFTSYFDRAPGQLKVGTFKAYATLEALKGRITGFRSSIITTTPAKTIYFLYPWITRTPIGTLAPPDFPYFMAHDGRPIQNVKLPLISWPRGPFAPVQKVTDKWNRLRMGHNPFSGAYQTFLSKISRLPLPIKIDPLPLYFL